MIPILLAAAITATTIALLYIHATATAAADPTSYRHPAHAAAIPRRPVPANWTPLPDWVRLQLAPTAYRTAT